MSDCSKAKLYIHIGGAKCGSSSIQQFLKSNFGELHKQGYIVPDVEMSLGADCIGEQLQYFENCKENIPDARQDLCEKLLALRNDYYSKYGSNIQPAILISAENLSCSNDFASLFDGLDKEFDTKVIIYIRRQDDYFLSFWQQWYLKENDDLWAWVLSSLRWMGDWDNTIEPWLNIFGEENIVVRRFSRKYFKDGDLIVDFLSLLGISVGSMELVINENPSYNDGVTALASSVNDVFDGIHDNGFYQMMADWGGPATFKKYPSQIMSLCQRKALVSYYHDSNERVKDRFFSTESDQLFESINDQELKVDISGSIEGRLEILTRLVFGSYNDSVKRKSDENKLANKVKRKLKKALNNMAGNE